MRLWRQLLLTTWYHGTYPYRALVAQRRNAAGRAPITILTYHRVADDGANDWTTSRTAFAQDMKWLQEHVELVSLEEAQQRIRSRRNEQPCVSITFDDGYAVNCEYAIPLLLDKRIPVTYFVCTEAILHATPFAHDLLMGNRLTPNTLSEVRALADAGFSIGAHSRTHADFGRITDLEVLRDELVTAGEELQAAIGHPIHYFAFPFGGYTNLNAHAFHIAYEVGYEGVCSAYGGYNFPGDDGFHLQRISVDGPQIRMKNWVTVDPWKLRRVRRFFYGPEVAPRPPVRVESP